MPKQDVITEGQPGSEMYMIVSGELEVTQGGVRLGFLSEGSFFGEAAVLAADSSVQAILRTRTVKAVISCELCFLNSRDLWSLVRN